MRAPLLSLRCCRHDGGISEGILRRPPVCGVVGWDVMMKGVDLLFSVAVCMKGTIVWEWENVLRAVDRLRIWEVLLGVVGSFTDFIVWF
jgi:hypothetical protein